jgi:hypothetical protein
MKNSLHKEIATEARRAAPLKSDLVECWRIGAKTCRHRAYDGARALPFKLGHSRTRGNPLCAFSVGICHRCTRSLCPIRAKVEAGASQEGGAGA